MPRKLAKTICRSIKDLDIARLFIYNFVDKVIDYAINDIINEELAPFLTSPYQSALDLCIIAGANQDICNVAFKRGVCILRELSPDKRLYWNMEEKEKIRFNSDLKKRLLDIGGHARDELRTKLEDRLFGLFYEIEENSRAHEWSLLIKRVAAGEYL
jgi:hypothetical protein